jgi:hypothetical protein
MHFVVFQNVYGVQSCYLYVCSANDLSPKIRAGTVNRPPYPRSSQPPPLAHINLPPTDILLEASGFSHLAAFRMACAAVRRRPKRNAGGSETSSLQMPFWLFGKSNPPLCSTTREIRSPTKWRRRSANPNKAPHTLNISRLKMQAKERETGGEGCCVVVLLSCSRALSSHVT